jgi:transcriptional regulator NrdR family protein
MRPSECPKCQKHFTLVIEAQTIHVLRKEGEAAAQAFVDEKLEPFHEEHENDDIEVTLDHNYQQEMR